MGWSRRTFYWIERCNIIKQNLLPKISYMFQTLPIVSLRPILDTYSLPGIKLYGLINQSESNTLFLGDRKQR